MVKISTANLLVDDELLSPNLEPVSREMLHEQIYKILCENLMMGRFAPGQKLPLRGLASSLGTSLMPVRDALQRLESLGCLISTSQRTMIVPILNPEENEGVNRLRSLLEGEAARMAATHRTEDQLNRLRELCDDIRRAGETNDLDLFLSANYHFHMTIAEASNIVFLTDILEPLWMRIGPGVRAAKPDRLHLEKAVRKHEVILKCLEEGQPDGAEVAIRNDISECSVDIMKKSNAS